MMSPHLLMLGFTLTTGAAGGSARDHPNWTESLQVDANSWPSCTYYATWYTNSQPRYLLPLPRKRNRAMTASLASAS